MKEIKNGCGSKGKIRAFTNYMHGYNYHAQNAHANSTMCTTQNLCTLLIPLCKNNLNQHISHADHYDLRK